MTELSKIILDKWQVRKTRQQKTAFIDFMKSQIPELTVEEGGFGKNRNLVVGDVKSAKVILTAHYDTCAQLPFPNFMTPKNIWVYLGYSILICLPFLILVGVLAGVTSLLTDDRFIVFLCSYFPSMGLLFWMLLGGKPNPHTANDNTSGVIQLTEIWAKLTEEQRKNVALVFFDNEENGLLGSAYFAKLHKKDNLKDKLIFNFDCVSYGDNILLVLNKTAMAKYGEAMTAAFPGTEEKSVEVTTKAFYPSDQANFPTNAAAAALKKHKWFGLYMDKIHTKDDCVFDQRNIDFLTEGTLRFLDTTL